ncbi:MAG: TM2 domain-containing protein [Rhodospirillales bacterium]
MLNDMQRLLVEQRLGNEAPSMGIAYLLWALLGLFSLHRFYIGETKSAILQVVLNFLVIGLIWTLIDVFLIPGLVRRRREELRSQITLEVEAAGT